MDGIQSDNGLLDHCNVQITEILSRITEANMWRLLRTEFEYNLLRTVGIFWIIPGFYLYTLLSSSASWFIVPILISVSIIIQIHITRMIEKRERQHVIIPVPTRMIGWARFFMVLIPVIVLIFVYLLIHLSVTEDLPSWGKGGFDLVMFSGLILMGFSISFIQQDLFHTRKNKSAMDSIILMIIIFSIVYGIPLILAILIKKQVLLSTPIVISFLITGLLLSFPAVRTFNRRKSYLE